MKRHPAQDISADPRDELDRALAGLGELLDLRRKEKAQLNTRIKRIKKTMAGYQHARAVLPDE